MRIPRFWARTIQGPSPRTLSPGLLCLALALPPAAIPAASLDSLARAYRAKPSEATRGALETFARANASRREGALAQLALGQIQLDLGREAAAIDRLRAARERLPQLTDHIDYSIARCLIALNRKPEAIERLQAVIAFRPASPQRPWAVLLAAQLQLDLDRPTDAVELLRAHLASLPNPQGKFLYGTALRKAGAAAAAAMQWQEVYHDFPTSSEAEKAAGLLAELRAALGDGYPPVTAPAMIRRATLLMQAGRHQQAVRELTAMAPSVGGAERDLAQVRIGVARYMANENTATLAYLKSLKVSGAEADAERLHYVFAAARRLNRLADMQAAARDLDTLYPDSTWRLETLTAFGNHYLLENNVERYEPLYRACYESFPADASTAYCHWKVAWAHYLRRDAAFRSLLAEHVGRFPASEKAPAALYFLGRDAEHRLDLPAARAFYQEILGRYPNFFYATSARERLTEPALASAQPRAVAATDLAPPPPRRQADFGVDPSTQARIDRARLLAAAALDEQAEAELRHGARTDANPAPVSIELARIVSGRGEVDRGIRFIKSLAPGYLSWDFAEAPDDFWKLAFPLAFRDSIEKYSKAHGLDSLMLAALIRQESEFDPRAVSRSQAVGLTQIKPATAVEISRKLGLTYRSSMLYQPDTNLRMGTFYLKRMLDSVGGRWEAALAAYNAGLSRATAWLNWAEFREPAEFIETIPITETRNYVQTVLRNADLYRRLYGERQTAVTSSDETSAGKAARPAGSPGRQPGAVP